MDYNFDLSCGPNILFLPDIFMDTNFRIAGEDKNTNDNIPTYIGESSDSDSDFDLSMIPIEYTETFEVFLNKSDKFDSFEKTYANDIVKSSKINYVEDVEFKEIPKYYFNKQAWVESTNLYCNACGRQVKGRPWTILTSKVVMLVDDDSEPYSMSPHQGNKVVEVIETSDDKLLTSCKKQSIKQIIAKTTHGVFCDVTHMGWYFKYMAPDTLNNIWQAKQLSKELYNEWTGNELIDFPIAEDFNKLACRCGSGGLSDEAYDTLNKKKLKMFVKT